MRRGLTAEVVKKPDTENNLVTQNYRCGGRGEGRTRIRGRAD